MKCGVVLFLIVSSWCLSVNADQLQEIRNSVHALQLQCESWREDDRQRIHDLQQELTVIRQQNDHTKREFSDIKRQNEILSGKLKNLNDLYENLMIKYNNHDRRDAGDVIPLGTDLRRTDTHFKPSFNLHNHWPMSSMTTQTPDVSSSPVTSHHWVGFGSQVADVSTAVPGHHWVGFGNKVPASAGGTGSSALPASTASTGQPGGTVSTGQLGGTVSTGQLGGTVSTVQLGATVSTGQLGGTVSMGQQGITISKGQQGSAGLTSKLLSTGSTDQQGGLGSTGKQGGNTSLSQQGVGLCTCQKGDVGPAGPPGIKGASGLKGDIGHVGPQGPKGNTGLTGSKGEPGPMGIQGPKGDAATMINQDGVAFYATLTNTINVRMGMTLKYATVLTNVGNRYDSSTGIFTCDMSGVYVFSWSTGVGHADTVHTELTKNDQMVNMQITAGAVDRDLSTSHTAVLSLQDNDRVQVRVYRITHGKTDSYILSHASTFSGFLLFKH